MSFVLPTNVNAAGFPPSRERRVKVVRNSREQRRDDRRLDIERVAHVEAAAVVHGVVDRSSIVDERIRGMRVIEPAEIHPGDNITNPIIVEPDNVFKADPMQELGSCDFFGDGREDKFMATGVTWWALSPVAQQWRYLNTMTERLPELELGKLDADAICDVFLRRSDPLVRPEKYSKSGTGPWVPFSVVHP